MTNDNDSDNKDEMGKLIPFPADAGRKGSPPSEAIGDQPWLDLVDRLCDLSDRDFDTVVIAARTSREFAKKRG